MTPEYELTDDLDAISAQLDALEHQGRALDQEDTLEAPGEDPGRQDPALLDQEDALDDAAFYVEMAEQAVLMVWPYLEYDDKTRNRLARKLAPVLAKRNGELPPWLLAYKEELVFLGSLAMVVGMSYRQIQDQKALDEDEAERAENRKKLGPLEDGLGDAQSESVLT